MVIKYNQSILINAQDISKNDWNPNMVTKSMQQTILNDIKQNGFIDSIVIQKHNDRLNKNNVIINGEHRFEALKQLGETEIPCIVLDISDSKAKVLSIRLNREHGELMDDRIAQILEDISPDKDLSFLQFETGIPIAELNVLTEMTFDDYEPVKKNDNKISKEESVTCPNCNSEFKIHR